MTTVSVADRLERTRSSRAMAWASILMRKEVVNFLGSDTLLYILNMRTDLAIAAGVVS